MKNKAIKNYILRTLLFLGGLAACYMITAFIKIDIDFRNWDTVDRALTIFLGIFIGFGFSQSK